MVPKECRRKTAPDAYAANPHPRHTGEYDGRISVALKSMPADMQAGRCIVVTRTKPSDPNRPGKLFTIRGRQVLTINTTVNDLITFAYSPADKKRILNAPPWMDEKYDVDGVPDIEGQPTIFSGA